MAIPALTTKGERLLPERVDLNSEKGIQLWNSARSGDSQALAQLLRNSQDMIFRFCCSRLDDKSLAVEATQETAVRLIDKLSTFSGRGKLSTWILGFANNVCREQRRLRQRWKNIDQTEVESEPTSDGSVSGVLAAQEEAGRLRLAIAKLPERQQEAIVLRYLESLSVDETAKVMKVSSGTVKATISQALNNLRAKFKP